MKRSVIILASFICTLLVLPLNGQEKVRIEKDLLREKEIPVEAYYGVQTARALENFQISGIKNQSISRVQHAIKRFVAQHEAILAGMGPAVLTLDDVHVGPTHPNCDALVEPSPVAVVRHRNVFQRRSVRFFGSTVIAIICSSPQALSSQRNGSGIRHLALTDRNDSFQPPRCA